MTVSTEPNLKGSLFKINEKNLKARTLLKQGSGFFIYIQFTIKILCLYHFCQVIND